MTSKMSSTRLENAKKRKPDVFERLSSVDKKRIENVKRQPRKSSSQESPKTNLSKPISTGVFPSAQNRRPDLGKYNKRESLAYPISEKPPPSLKGKFRKSETSVEKVSEKTLLENVPENINKDSEEEKHESSNFYDSDTLGDNSPEMSACHKTDDLDALNVCVSEPLSSHDVSNFATTDFGDPFPHEEKKEKMSPTLWIPDKNNLTHVNADSDIINNENNNHLSQQPSTRRSLTSKEILREMKEHNLKKVDDQDKDICDDDKLSEDDEFYKIKVQTRLVSYENSTLVIRNTSKGKDDSAAGSEIDGEENVNNNHDSVSLSSSASLHSSSSELAALEEGADVPTNGDAVESTGETRSLSLPSSSVRSRLGQYVTKGKLILSDVRNSPYMPDVKTPLSRLQNVTRRSFRSMLAYSSNAAVSSRDTEERKRSSDPFCFNASFGGDYSHSVVRLKDDSKNSSNKEFLKPKVVSTNFNNLESSNELSPQGGVDSEPHSNSTPDATSTSRNILTNENEMEASNPLSTNLSEQQTLSVSDRDSQESPRESTTYPEYFSSCYCSGFASDNRIPTQQEETILANCSCKLESELPLEIREILDCDHARMWWTITGNFGNILPIDWSKTYTRQKYLPVLNLNEAKKLDGAADSLTPSPCINGQDDEDEVARDLDLHQLILAGAQAESEPVKSAEEVIKEIDDIMQEGSSSEDEGIDASSASNSSSQPELRKLPPPLYHDKLKDMNINELNEIVMELEAVIRQYSETLIAELAHRDELEYEKELKNTFISLLLQIQNKRRNYNVEKKRVKKPLGTEPKYLTTVIPYDVGHGPPHNQTILMLIKILTAINGDIPTVPTLLTDYILKVLCPSTS